MTSKGDLKNVVVQYDLPFVLRVPDSIEKEDVPDDYQHYIFEIDGIPARPRFQKGTRDLGGIHIATEDRRGLLSYSTVQVWFDHHFFDQFPFSSNYRERHEELLWWSLRFVNLFLDAYRNTTQAYWIRHVKKSEIPSVRYVAIMRDGSKDPFTKGTLGTGVGLGSLVDGQDDQELRSLLSVGFETDDLQRLAYSVATLFENEEYWSAALAVEIMFEAKVARIFRHSFSQQGQSSSNIDSLFEFANGRARSITNLLKTYVPELAGVDLEDQNTPLGQQWQPWCNNARDLRNEIAHGNTIVVNRQQALDALIAVRDYLGELEQVLPDVRSTTIVVPSQP